MNPGTIYPIGISIALVIALLWSFVFDKQKPPTVKEFAAKLAARALLLIVLFAAVMGFLYLAFGGSPG